MQKFTTTSCKILLHLSQGWRGKCNRHGEGRQLVREHVSTSSFIFSLPLQVLYLQRSRPHGFHQCSCREGFADNSESPTLNRGPHNRGHRFRNYRNCYPGHNIAIIQDRHREPCNKPILGIVVSPSLNHWSIFYTPSDRIPTTLNRAQLRCTSVRG